MHTSEEIQDQLSVLSRLPHFMKSPDFLSKSNPSFEVATYSANDVILQEGAVVHKLYWVLSGSCKCTKKIPFVQRKNGNDKELFICDSSPLRPGDEVIERTFEIQQLDTSDHFPGLPPASIQAKEFGQIDHENSALISQFLRESDADSSVAEYSVIAVTKTEIASLLKSDYIKFASEEMIEDTLMQKNLYHVSVAEVQRTFLEEMNWLNYKKQLMEGIKKNK